MTTVQVDGLAAALGSGFSLCDWLDDNAAELTTDHARSSHGMPVLVKGGRVYGPADLPGVTLHLSATNEDTINLVAPARAAGWTVAVVAWCDLCGGSLPDPESRHPGARHEACR